MSSLPRNGASRSRPHLRPMLRLQWESAQDAYVLFSPEGNGEAQPERWRDPVALRRYTLDLDDIIGELEDLFSASALAADVYRFIEHARQCGWVD